METLLNLFVETAAKDQATYAKPNNLLLLSIYVYWHFKLLSFVMPRLMFVVPFYRLVLFVEEMP